MNCYFTVFCDLYSLNIAANVQLRFQQKKTMDTKFSIGELIDDSDKCHKTIYSKALGLVDIALLTNEIQELLQQRTDHDGKFEINSTICLHHKAALITRYETLEKYCSDPFRMYEKRITKALRVVDVETAKRLKIKPGQKLCVNCRMKATEK